MVYEDELKYNISKIFIYVKDIINLLFSKNFLRYSNIINIKKWLSEFELSEITYNLITIPIVQNQMNRSEKGLMK